MECYRVKQVRNDNVKYGLVKKCKCEGRLGARNKRRASINDQRCYNVSKEIGSNKYGNKEDLQRLLTIIEC